MAAPVDPHVSKSPLASEHDAFRIMAREIKTDLERLQQDPRSRECLLLLFTRTRSMRERLRSHFSREEDAWSRSREALDGATRRWVALLIEQHRSMEGQLDLVCSQLEACLDAGATTGAFCDESMRALLRDLTLHELSENRLFQRSIFEELDGI